VSKWYAVVPFCATALINSQLDLRPAEGGVKSVKNQKEVAARPLKIRFNPHDPLHPRSHPSTRGVAEQNLSYNPNFQIQNPWTPRTEFHYHCRHYDCLNAAEYPSKESHP